MGWVYAYLIVGAFVLLVAVSNAGKTDLATELAAKASIRRSAAVTSLWVASLLFVLVWPFAIIYSLGRKVVR